jgi:hypothetical protein
MNQQEKIALSETQRAFITPIVGGLAAGGVAYGLPAALDKVREVRVRRNRDKYITAMKDVHPDLKGVPKKDLHVAYNSMAMHSPHVLRDPLLGGQELLRMSKYRQADLNSLNEMNKLRGNSMLDQAFMNATNFVSSGISEGFKGYQGQRIADQDQAYREKMDQFRMDMDRAKSDFEQKKFDYTQRRDLNRDAYQKDRDAQTDARDRTRDMRQVQSERARRKEDRNRTKMLKNDLRLKRNAADTKSHYDALEDGRRSSKHQMEKEKHDAWVNAGRPASASYTPQKPKKYKSSLSALKGSNTVRFETSPTMSTQSSPPMSKTQKQKMRNANRKQEKRGSAEFNAVVRALRDRNL